MYEICCQCEWIPGRTGFPPHVHRTRTVLLSRGRRLETMTSFIPQPGTDILEQEDIVLIDVDWKAVVRGLPG